MQAQTSTSTPAPSVQDLSKMARYVLEGDFNPGVKYELTRGALLKKLEENLANLKISEPERQTLKKIIEATPIDLSKSTTPATVAQKNKLSPSAEGLRIKSINDHKLKNELLQPDSMSTAEIGHILKEVWKEYRTSFQTQNPQAKVDYTPALKALGFEDKNQDIKKGQIRLVPSPAAVQEIKALIDKNLDQQTEAVIARSGQFHDNKDFQNAYAMARNSDNSPRAKAALELYSSTEYSNLESQKRHYNRVTEILEDALSLGVEKRMDLDPHELTLAKIKVEQQDMIDRKYGFKDFFFSPYRHEAGIIMDATMKVLTGAVCGIVASAAMYSYLGGWGFAGTAVSLLPFLVNQGLQSGITNLLELAQKRIHGPIKTAKESTQDDKQVLVLIRLSALNFADYFESRFKDMYPRAHDKYGSFKELVDTGINLARNLHHRGQENAYVSKHTAKYRDYNHSTTAVKQIADALESLGKNDYDSAATAVNLARNHLAEVHDMSGLTAKLDLVRRDMHAPGAVKLLNECFSELHKYHFDAELWTDDRKLLEKALFYRSLTANDRRGEYNDFLDKTLPHIPVTNFEPEHADDPRADISFKLRTFIQFFANMSYVLAEAGSFTPEQLQGYYLRYIAELEQVDIREDNIANHGPYPLAHLAHFEKHRFIRSAGTVASIASVAGPTTTFASFGLHLFFASL